MYHKWQSYDVWLLRYEAWKTEFFVTVDHFLPFYHPNNQKNQNFEKLKKNIWRQIILHMCIIDDNHMMYGSWDIKHDREFFIILGHFLPFHPHNNPKKSKFWIKMKKSPRSSLPPPPLFKIFASLPLFSITHPFKVF